MHSNQRSQSCEAHPINGGNGTNSYSKNSLWQRGIGETAKDLIRASIAEKLHIKNFSSSNTFRIADLGCSVGPNTFFAVQNIVEAVQQKCTTAQEHNPHQFLEFQVFFNDLTSNDFNTLLASLPPERQYFPAAVPGSFYGRLFPKSSLHFVYSSIALQWRSEVPNEVLDKSSSAWNKGRVLYPKSNKEVIDAYKAQFEKDMEIFLNARAQEIVYGGLVALVVPSRRDGTPHSQHIASMIFELLGSCLHDMAQEGVISEEQFNTFNIPLYYASPEELILAAEKNGYFEIEVMKEIPQPKIEQSSASMAQFVRSNIRAVTEGLLAGHFGHEILEELFEIYQKKLEEFDLVSKSASDINLFVLLKRKEGDY